MTSKTGGDQSKQVEELKKKLEAAEAKTRDYGELPTSFPYTKTTRINSRYSSDILKKQAGQQAKEYDRLATEYNKATGAVSDKRKD